MKNFLKITRRYFLYALPAVLFFSYQPRFLLGESASMYFELSLPLIWLFIFAIISIPDFIFYIKKIFQQNKLTVSITAITLIFVIYTSLSIFWSLNPLRTFLTSGILWCISISAFSLFEFNFDEQFKTKFLKIFLISSVIVCVFCWLQCILNIFDLPNDITLLCPGCTYKMFGFPHPNGFAIEPQFMGNLLLAPSLLAFYLFYKKPSKKLLAIASFIVSTLFLTFSRGAIYAFCLSFVLFVIIILVKYRDKKIFQSMFIVLFGFLITLFMQGIFAAISPTNDTFVTGITKSIHQLSLGTIDLRPTAKNQITDSDSINSTFDGYVAESTETRLDLTSIALEISTSSPIVFLFGVGLGGAGTALSAREIIQNEYASILLELGIIGFIIATLFIALIFIKILKSQKTSKPYFISLIFAFLLTLGFFSGLPNALHIYLLPPLLFFIL